MNTLDTALALVDEPICICLDKNPGFAGRAWHKVVWTPESLLDAFCGPQADSLSVGLRLGEATAYIDVEGDSETSEADWLEFAEGNESAASWTSARGRHRLFTVDPAQFAALRLAGAGAVLKVGSVEFRLGTPEGSSQSVLPPYGGREWVVGSTPAHAEPLPATLLNKLVRYSVMLSPDRQPDRPAESPERLDRPGDAYNESADWRDILGPLGWKSSGEGRWTRPGKTTGVSATTGFCGTTARPNCLYVFSTAEQVAPFEPDKTYSPFEAYGLLEFPELEGAERASAAARSLGPQVEFDVIEEPVEEAPRPVAEWKKLVLEISGFVSEFSRYHAKRSHHHDLVKGAVGGLLLQSFLCGRKIKSETGVRPNMDVLMVSPSGTGKTQLVNSMTSLLSRATSKGLPYRAFASGEALEDCLRADPHGIAVYEECAHLLRKFADIRDHNAASLVSAWKSLYSESSNESFMPRLRAKGNKVSATVSPIDQPYFVSAFFGTPKATLGSISSESLEDGFVARLFLAAFMDGAAPLNEKIDPGEAALPALLDHARGWLDMEVSYREMPPSDNIQAAPIDPKTIVAEDPDLQKRFLRKWEDRANQLSQGGDYGPAAVWRRAFETMSKLELIIAASRGVEGCSVTTRDTELAAGIVESVFQDKIDLILSRERKSPREQEFEDNVEKAYKELKKKPEGYMPQSQLARNKHFTADDAKKIRETLACRGLAGFGQRYLPGVKKPTYYWWLPKKAPGSPKPEEEK